MDGNAPSAVSVEGERNPTPLSNPGPLDKDAKKDSTRFAERSIRSAIPDDSGGDCPPAGGASKGLIPFHVFHQVRRK